MRTPLLLTLCVALSAPVMASAERVVSKPEFVDLVQGKKLTRPLVELQVTPDGAIAGTGAAWDVTGKWTWQDGYFCRDLVWGGDSLGYNCQMVTATGDRITFTSDRGQGRSAGFTLR
ncbi:dihydrodipicolinate reductase [Roseivivax sp. CAU 1753]